MRHRFVPAREPPRSFEAVQEVLADVIRALYEVPEFGHLVPLVAVRETYPWRTPRQVVDRALRALHRARKIQLLVANDPSAHAWADAMIPTLDGDPYTKYGYVAPKG